MVFIKFKKGQSQIVSTVLLILIVVIAITLISVFVMRIIQNSLNTECHDISEKYEIKNNEKYTCWNGTGNYTLIQVHIGDINDSIKSLEVKVLIDGESEAFEISKREVNNDSRVLPNNGQTNLELPTRNGEKVYRLVNITSKPERIELIPLTKSEKTCQADINDNIPECS
jgi:flagellin-like protein